MKRIFACALCAALAGCALKSEAQAAVAVTVGYAGGGAHVAFRYDSYGFPIWGYAPTGQPIYGYDPYGHPVFVMTKLYRGCYVPNWRPAPYYRGSYGYPAHVHYVNYNNPMHTRYDYNHRVQPAPPRKAAPPRYHNAPRGRGHGPSLPPNRGGSFRPANSPHRGR